MSEPELCFKAVGYATPCSDPILRIHTIGAIDDDGNFVEGHLCDAHFLEIEHLVTEPVLTRAEYAQFASGERVARPVRGGPPETPKEPPPERGPSG